MLQRRPNNRTTAGVVAGLALIAVSVAAVIREPQVCAAGSLRPAQLGVEVASAPNPMIAFGKAYLVYELILTSYDSSPVKVTGIRVRGAGGAKTEFSFSGKPLADMIRPVTVTGEASDYTTVETGQVRLAYVWLRFDGADQVPRRLMHFVGFQVRRGKETKEGDLELAPVEVNQAPALSIGPPLRGGDWIAEAAPSNTSYHRRARFAINGQLYFAQRFAIDYEKLLPDGKSYSGDAKKNQSYPGYGAEVIAVADARVAAIKDGIPENVPGPTSRAVPITLETAGGNFVALDLGYGRYALYGHMIPGSLKVKPGEHVKRGQTLGRLGNSGNSTLPHLHFQIADAPAFLAANGLPYLYDQVDVKPSRVVDASSDPPVLQATGRARRYLATMLLENDLVGFPR